MWGLKQVWAAEVWVSARASYDVYAIVAVCLCVCGLVGILHIVVGLI